MKENVMTDLLTGLVKIRCCECSVTFGMSDQLYNLRQRDGQAFYCPVGHKQFFSESETAILKKQLQDALSSKQYYKDRADHYRESMVKGENRNRGLKSALTMTRRRIANGKCPCCKKTFDDLKNHIKNDHPKYKDKVDQ